MPVKPQKREDLIMQRVSFDIGTGTPGDLETSLYNKVEGVIIQALEYGEGCVRLQIKEDGTGNLRWVELRRKVLKPELPNAPREQTCGECGRRAKRRSKTATMVTYSCSAGHKTLVSIGENK